MQSLSHALTWPWMQDFVNTYGWIWPLCEIIHYTGMSLIIGIIVGLDLRILGLYKGVPIGAFKPLVNIAIFGFILNLIGGIIFVTGTNTGAEFYVENLSFQCKVVALLIAFVNLLIFRFSGLEHRVYAVPAGGTAPGSAKAVAWISIVSWIAVIIFGRLLMYNDTLLYFLGL
ncbi:MAG: hypothetical protein U1F39_05675 [Steroidobacteraceae bacterium]